MALVCASNLPETAALREIAIQRTARLVTPWAGSDDCGFGKGLDHDAVPMRITRCVL